MERLSSKILMVLYEIHGPERIVDLFSDPFWFQAFNNVIGMDWDSSGSTTVVTAVVKKVSWREDLGFLVLGGKGARARETIEEIPLAVRRLSLGEESIERLEMISRLGAKIDSVMLQDGYSLYHHALFVSRDGNWAIVQQGMNTSIKMARRYHINKKSLDLETLVDPHSGVAAERLEKPLNLVDRGSLETRRVIEDLFREGTNRILSLVREVNTVLKGLRPLTSFVRDRPGAVESLSASTPDTAGRRVFTIPYYRPVNISREMIEAINEAQLRGAERIIEILGVRGVGPETMRALVLVADLIFNAPPSNRDPVTHPIDPFKYSYAHGGKDGVPYKVRRDLLEKTIITLEEAIERARLGDRDKMRMLSRLARYSHLVLGDSSLRK